MNQRTGRRTLAIIGLGNVAEPHLVAYQTLPEVEVIAAVEPRIDRREEVCSRYGLRGFASAEAMFSECRPDIACILTPAQTHRSMTECCAAAGAHILCEKPMAVTLDDAIAMSECCVRHNVQFFYGSSYRYLPAVQEAKALISSGAIGTVRLVIEEAISGQGAAAFQALSSAHYPVGGPGGGGYGLVDHGIHMLDIFPWLCDSTISAVLGRGDRTGAIPRAEFSLLTMLSGATGILVYDGSTRPTHLPAEGVFSEGRAWIDGRGWVGEEGLWEAGAGNIRIYGSEGSIRVFHYANKLFINRTGMPTERPLPTGTTPLHFARQMRAFCVGLDRGEGAPTPASVGIRALRTLLAIYESEGGGWQVVGDDE